MNKRWKISIGIIAGLTVVAAIVWSSPIGRFILTGGLSKMNEQPFDAQQWKVVRNGDQTEKRIRLMMVDDLLENKLKTGIDSMAVKEMLGEPERQFGFSYGLGTLTEGIDPFYLVVNFDSAGNVSKLDVANEGRFKDEDGAFKIEVNNQKDSQ
jgi:hypothetical protein